MGIFLWEEQAKKLASISKDIIKRKLCLEKSFTLYCLYKDNEFVLLTDIKKKPASAGSFIHTIL
ncbi:MAG: hypothetical protein CVU05_02325 [Bacteroidetes bacterium HGW-Bacteroidetes-21]|nr:MAG: hypothetical protein CVU05_02325 [Bacteroidetes bacterium HGW-Bacteroidetes-21]